MAAIKLHLIAYKPITQRINFRGAIRGGTQIFVQSTLSYT